MIFSHFLRLIVRTNILPLNICKTRLGNPYVREIVDQSVQEYLMEYFVLHPDVFESVISKSVNACKVCCIFIYTMHLKTSTVLCFVLCSTCCLFSYFQLNDHENLPGESFSFQTALAVKRARDVYRSESVAMVCTIESIPKKLTNCPPETSGMSFDCKSEKELFTELLVHIT